MNITQKITLAAVVVVLLLAVNVFLIQRMIGDTARLADVEEPLQEATLEMEINAGEIARATLDYIWDHEERDLTKIQDSEADFERFAQEFERLAETEEERALGRKVIDLYQQFTALGHEITALSKQRKANLSAFRHNVEEIDAFIDEKLQTSIDRSTASAISKLEAALEMEINIDEAFAAIEGYVLEPDPALQRKVVDSEADFARFAAQYRETPLSADEEAWLDMIDGAFLDAVETGLQIITLMDQLREKLAAFETILEEMDSILDDEIQVLVLAETVRAANDARRSGELAIVFTIAAGLFIFAVVAATGRLVSRAITDATSQLTDGAAAFREGNLDYRIPVTRQDEVGALADAFNVMAEKRKQAEEEQARLEVRFHQAQKIESIGRLAGGIAHDQNNLLVPILGYSEMLLDDPDLDDTVREFVTEIQRAGIRARDLVHQLLAFSRKQALQMKPVNVNDVMTGMETLLRRTIPEDIAMEIIPSPDIRSVMADIGQLEQVILNLAANAADAMASGGRLTIETAPAHLNEDYAATHPSVVPGAHVMLAVSDTGSGMDDETREFVFEPFFTTKGEQGNGLGLATVYGIVKQHGGNIWVYSEPGKGTTFKVYLPVSEQAHVEERPDARTLKDLQGSETILLVEDNEQVLALAHAVLRRQGYTVLAAGNGPEAVTALASHHDPVHLLLTDVVMPGMNGNTLFAEVAKMRPGVKVLFMSGYTANVILDRGGLEEDSAFIQKPFTVQALTAKVREVLGHD